MNVPDSYGGKNDGITLDVYSISSIIFVGIVLILTAQYVDKKIAFALAGLIFLTSLILNIEKLKGVFTK